MFSTRYAPAVLALLALASVPTVIHSYMDSTVPDGHSARALSVWLAGKGGVPTSRRATWGEAHFSSTDWVERLYAGPPAVKLFVGRSHDAKRLYHHPELAVDYGRGYGRETIIRLGPRADVPVHLLTGTDTNRRRIALYTLHHGGEYVADPIFFQLRTSLRLLFTRRQAMTLFFAAQDLGPDEEVESSSAAAILLAAMNEFERQSN